MNATKFVCGLLAAIPFAFGNGAFAPQFFRSSPGA